MHLSVTNQWPGMIHPRPFVVCFLLIASGLLQAAAQTDLPPVISSFSPPSGRVGTVVTIQGSNLGQATAVRFGTVAAQFAVFDAQQIAATVPLGAIDGLIAVETPGGVALSISVFQVLLDQPPVVHQFVPASGPVGTEVTIQGAFLSTATEVRFNGVPAVFNAGFSGDSLVATVPAGAASGPVTVVTPFGTYVTTVSFDVTTAPAPTVTGFSPARGAVGTRVVISGSNFAAVNFVHFNGVPAQFTLFGNTITAFVPPGASSGPITVGTGGGTAASASPFVVTVPGVPLITGVTPGRGRPGSTVTITGESLGSATAVLFNGVSATFSALGTSLLATVPAAASSGVISVVTPNGTAVSDVSFSVVDPLAPEINLFSPVTGDVGTVVAITGTNLNAVTSVNFGGAEASFTVISNSEVRATVPSGATTGEIVVTTPAGIALSGAVFSVAPRITAFEPSHGLAGTSVTLRGVNFTGTIAVLFAGVSASFVEVSPTEIRAVVPEGASSGSISLATPAGFANSGSNFLLPPILTRFDPPSGQPGTEVTLTGDNLLGVTSVRFGGVEAAFTPISFTTVVVQVPVAASDGPITVTTPAGSVISANNFFVGLFSDVVVGLSTFPESVEVGDLLRYTITVTNRGPLEAANVVLTDRLPAATELLFLPSGADCSVANNILTCNLGLLGAGADRALRVSVTITGGPYLVNELAVTSSASDPDLSNNSVRVVTVLEGAPPFPTEIILSAARSGSQVELSWTALALGFVLESSPALGSAAAWSVVSSPPLTASGKNFVVLAASSGTRYFRLRQP